MPYKILIADDEKELVELLALHFEKDGNEVFPAYDGASAYEIVRSKEIDCALLDVMMPSLNGFQLIKKNPRNKRHSDSFSHGKSRLFR